MFEILSICKGGGYRYCRTNPKHPNANIRGLYPLHRVMMENKIGRLLTSREAVHHIDGDRTNDTIDNLQLLSRSEHARLHSRTVRYIDCVCPICGKRFSLRPNIYRTRVKLKKDRRPCCSRKCGYVSNSITLREATGTQQAS